MQASQCVGNTMRCAARLAAGLLAAWLAGGYASAASSRNVIFFIGDGRDLRTILEWLRDKGKRTGLVTTAFMTDATPGAFGAHQASRGNTGGVAYDYLHRSRPNVLFGGGGSGMTPSAAAAAGYVVATDLDGLLAIDTGSTARASGQFGYGGFPYEFDGLGALPHLSQMTGVALHILAQETNARERYRCGTPGPARTAAASSSRSCRPGGWTMCTRCSAPSSTACRLPPASPRCRATARGGPRRR